MYVYIDTINAPYYIPDEIPMTKKSILFVECTVSMVIDGERVIVEKRSLLKTLE